LGYNGGGNLRRLPFGNPAAAVPAVALSHVSFGYRHQALVDVGLELQVGKAILPWRTGDLTVKGHPQGKSVIVLQTTILGSFHDHTVTTIAPKSVDDRFHRRANLLFAYRLQLGGELRPVGNELGHLVG